MCILRHLASLTKKRKQSQKDPTFELPPDVERVLIACLLSVIRPLANQQMMELSQSIVMIGTVSSVQLECCTKCNRHCTNCKLISTVVVVL